MPKMAYADLFATAPARDSAYQTQAGQQHGIGFRFRYGGCLEINGQGDLVGEFVMIEMSWVWQVIVPHGVVQIDIDIVRIKGDFRQRIKSFYEVTRG